MSRDFRTRESYAAEKATRRLIKPLLERAGFTKVRDERTLYGRTESQTVHVLDTFGAPMSLRVRLCWRERPDRQDPRSFSAAQLQARVKAGTDWIRSITSKIEREKQRGITHLLLAQPFQDKIIQAAMIPIDAVVPIWKAQRDTSEKLIKAGRRGARATNQAMNGSSPTLWLRDDRAPEVAKQLWGYPGVVDPIRRTVAGSLSATSDQDDSIDDLPGVDYTTIGSDHPDRFARQTSGVKRDLKVRREVLKRSKGKCERDGTRRAYPGFLDVHHVLGAGRSDRVWNCVALCPNCHREAHFAPNRESINADLLAFAKTISGSKSSSEKDLRVVPA